MAFGIQGLAAERARGPAGRHQRLGTPHEITRLRGTDAHAEQVRTLWLVVGDLDVISILSFGLRLDDHRVPTRVPGERHGADAEEVDHRLLERRCLVASGRSGIGADRIEELVEASRERSDLCLLQGHADDGSALACLEVEGTVAGLADRADDELVGLVEDEEAS